MRRAFVLAALCCALAPAEESPQKKAEREKKEATIRRRIELKEGFTSEGRRVAELFEAFALQQVRYWKAALELLVQQPPAALSDPIRYYLLDEDWEVQAFACRVAGAAGLTALMPDLEEAYEEARYPVIRRMAVEAAARFAGAKHAPAAALLKRGLKDDEPGVRLLAVEGLERLEDLDALRTAKEDKDHDTRYRALAALARLGDGTAQEDLFNGFKSYIANKDLQRRASLQTHDIGERYGQFLNALALGHWSGPAAVDLLRTALLRERDYRNKLFLSVGAAAALGKARPVDEKAAKTREKALKAGLGDGDAVVRALAALGAGYAGEKEFVRYLQRLVKDAQLDVRHNAVEALGHVADPAAASILASALKSERDVPVRLAAVRALSRHEGETAVDALAGALRDKRYMVRAAAARMLGRKGPAAASATRALVKAARDRDYGVREAAVVALARIGAPEGLDGLVGALKDRDRGVRIRTLRALARFPHGDAVKESRDAAERAVSILVSTRDIAERTAAHKCLVKVRSPHAVPPLLKELDVDAYSRRRAAFGVLRDYNGGRALDYAPSVQGTKRREAAKRWEDWWKGGGTIVPLAPPPKKRANQDILGFHRYTRDLRWRGIDLVLAYDSTGSMLPVIRAVKQRLDLLIEESGRIVPNLRMSLFTYRDTGEEYVYYGTPLTYATENLKAFVQVAEANRGGDLPEAVTATVQAAIEGLAWRPEAQKVIVVIGDAPYHPENRASLFTMVQEFGRKENRGTVHAIFTDPNRLGESIRARRTRAKGGVTYPFLERLREMASKAGGRAITIGDTEMLISEILILSFGEQWRAELESRLDFE